MPIYIGTSTKNQQQISHGGTQMQKVYVGDKLVWEKAPTFTPIKYGMLYNWYAASDSRNIASIGWSVPTRTEYITLANYVGTNLTAGAYLKEVGLSNWQTPNTGATNYSGFNARGSGYRVLGVYGHLYQDFNSWSSSLESSTYAYFFALFYNNTTEQHGAHRTYEGKSLRLLKDTTTLTNGQTGQYIGNDGKAYRTICIGTQEWLADNLAETKYRDGSTIPEVTDNTAWSALTTGGCCAYNNDHSNI